MKSVLQVLLLSVFSLSVALAQKTVTGSVLDDAGMPLPGATVLEQGTSNGVTTDFDGNYSIEVAEGATLEVSFVGYTTATEQVGAGDTLNFTLNSDNELDEIVVSALGVSREKKSIGYAQQSVAGEQLVQAKDTDLNVSLTGKVAGVQMIGGSSSTFDAGFLRLRGETGVLYVVDGVKLFSQTDVNTDNIANITVLKGAAATALYGVDARNGVVLITTKSAEKGQSSFSIDHTTQMTNVSILPNYQDEYGGGYYQEWDTFAYNPGSDPVEWAAFNGQRIPYYAADESWGPRLDGTLVRHWDSWIPGHPEFGQLRPWEANPDNVRDFYQTAISNNTSLVWAKGGEDYSIRTAIRNLKQTLVMPNSGRDQVDVNVRGSFNLTDKIELYAGMNYQFRETRNSPTNGYGGLGSNFNQWWQRQLDMDRLKSNYFFEGNYYSWNSRSARNSRPLYWDAPHFGPDNNLNLQRKDVIFGNVGANFDLGPGLKANLELRRRFNNYVSNGRTAFGGLELPAFSEASSRYIQNELWGFISYDKRFAGNIDMNLKVGYQMQQNRSNAISASTVGGLSVPNFYSIATSVDRPNYSSTLTQDKLQSNFAAVSLGYNSLVYLDASYRLDWGSTANADDNRLETLGLSASFVFDKLVDFGGLLSFGKLRGGFSQAPIFPGAYQTTTVYNVGNPYGTNASFAVPNTQANPELLGGTRDEMELGLEMRFLKDRIGLDVTYFDRKDKQLPVAIPVAASSGFSGLSINSGQTSSNGIEFTLSGTPIKTENLIWDLSVNFATLEKKQDFIAEGIDTQILDSWVSWGGLQLQNRVGEEYGTFVGRRRATDANGNYILTSSGRYTFDTGEVLGSLLPDFTGGIVSNLAYKNWYMNLGLDFQSGGRFFSTSNMFSYYSGLHENTVGNNDLGNPLRDDPANGGGVRRQGVDANGNPVDVYMESQTWGGSYFGVHDEWLYDATYLKLRQMRIGYQLPQEMIDNTPFTGVDISLIGNNLLLLYSKVGHGGGLDPSEIEGSGSIAGSFRHVEGGQLPPARTIGLNVKLNF